MVSLIKYTVMTSVILLMLSVGLRTAPSQILEVIRNRSSLFRGLAVNFIIVPLLFYLSLYWLPVSADIKIGIMLMAAAPIAPMAPLPFVGMAKGDIAYSAGLMVICAVLCVALTPLILTLAFPSSQSGVQVNPLQIVQTLIVVQLIPIGLGMTIQRVSASWSRRLLKFVPILGQLGLLVGVSMLMIYQAKQMLAIGVLGVLINIAMVILCLVVGDLALFRESGELRRSLAVSTAVRNIPLAFVIANASFSGSLVPPVTLVFTTFSMVLSVVYAKVMLRPGAGAARA